ncbi:hypothetical protein PG999_004203 [Apiospora kogelbergensis]|uniref:Nucleosome assembly protein n=1 Tax=Apiospora kogelbergensis TaxID=1337665 RepID=A0AAW0QYN8_9PEZI
MSMPEEIVIDPAVIKELQQFEDAISDVDLEIAAKQWLMTKDIFAKRQNSIAKIPGFWSVVFDKAVSELEAAITPRDNVIFQQALTAINVDRPEIPAGAKTTDTGIDKFGEPRSMTITFHFKENDFFTDSVLAKTFYYRYGNDGSTGLVSEPVKINWKAGKDVTEGLSDAAYGFWQAQKADASQQLDAALSGDARKARDAKAREMPQYKALAAMIEEKEMGATSFFNFFSYRGRWTSAAESVQAKAEAMAKRAKAGEVDEEEEEEEEEEFPEEHVETFPPGHDVAVTIGDDIFPSAIDYFLEDDIDSDIDLDSDDEDEEMEG